MEELSRRGFLSGMIACAAGAAAIGTLAGCAPSSQSGTETDKGTVAEKTEVLPWTKLNPQDDTYTTYTTDYSALFTPITIGRMQLKNRICKSAAGSDTVGRAATTIPQNAIDYYGRFADGGAALVILEDSVVSGFGLNPFYAMKTASIEEGIVEAKKIVDRVHQGGALIGTQLGIGTPLAPGDANAYTIDEIKTMVTQFGQCALYTKQAGFDCIEIKGATTDGLNQFVTRRYNKRTDEYGADTEENRVRFFKEIVQEIRAKCGEDFGIEVLINATEENDGNLGADDGYITLEESKYLARTLEAAGADFIQVRVGATGKEANNWATDTMHCTYGAHGSTGFGTQFDFRSHYDGMMDGSHDGVGAFIPMAKAMKSAVSVPVGCASVMDPRLAPDFIDAAVGNGDVDLVFMNRALTVDPELPNKLQAGKRDEVAPCCHCFHCHGKPYGEAEVCRVNPTTQFAYTKEFPEGYELTKAGSPKNITVIGGGVGGMEAAMIAARRGHKVTLYEKNSVMGGMLSFAEAIKGPHENLSDLRDYLVRQLELSGVTVNTGTEATLDTIKNDKPDSVIVAVGGNRPEAQFDGSVQMDDMGSATIGDRVIITGGNLQATDLAQYLLANGKQVTLVSDREEPGLDSEQSYWVRNFVKSHLYAHGVRVWNKSTLKTMKDGIATVVETNGVSHELPYDTVIECGDMVANTTLADEIGKAGFDVHVVGCDAPSNMQASIHAGYKVARYL